MVFRRKFLLIPLSFVVLLISIETIHGSEREEIKIKTIEAETISNDKDGNLILEGNVIINTNLLSFSSSSALLNESEGLLELVGDVEVISDNFEVNSSEMKANLNLQTFLAKSTEIYHENSNFGSTEEFVIRTSGDVELINTSVTSCSKEDPAWTISTKSITYLDGSKNVVIRGIKLKLKKIPIFYFPYVRTALSNESMSGFLTPGLNQTRNGVDISLPYYFNLAENYDLVLTPRHISSRGSGLASNFRYLNTKFTGEINVSGLSGDKRYKKETGIEDSRWNVSWQNKSVLSKNLYSNIDFQSTSDEYFFRDIGNDQFGETRTSYLPRKFSLTWKNPFLKINLGISRYQILNPFSYEEYKSKPNLTIQTYVSRKDLSFSIFANKSKFELDRINPLRSSYGEVDRLFLSPRVTFRKNLPSSAFLFSTGATYIKHNFDSLQESKSSPWVEMKYSVFLDKVNNIQVSSLIPVIKYVFVEDNYKNQTNLIDSRIISLDYSTIFQRGRFVGLDRFSENNKIIVGLERVSSSLAKDSFNSVSLGKAFYLKDRTYYEDSSTIRNSSPLVAEFKTKLRGNIWSKSLLEWDNESKKLNLASFGFSYQKNDLKRIEFRSIYRRQDPNKTYIPWVDKDMKTNHSELVTQWPLSKSINVFARWQKDHESNKSNDILFGFEYSNCCLKWGLMNRKWIEEDYFSWKNNYTSSFQALSEGLDPSIERSRTYVFFELKNIGRLGKEISKALSSTKLE